MATITLTTGVGTQQWTPPYDCVTIDKLELWGPGGSGGKRAGRATGGGSGAYNSINGPISVASLLVGGTVPYLIGQGGAAVSATSTAGNNGSAKTWFSAIGTYAADFGQGGQTGTSGTTAGGIGGLTANCVPTTNAKVGGSGGTCASATGASGGGASGSTAGVGVTAVAVSTAIAGAGATAPAGGGSGGAASIVVATNAIAGSAPGGGGGAINGASTGNSGAGATGQITITYTPVFATGTAAGAATVTGSPIVSGLAVGTSTATAQAQGTGLAVGTSTAAAVGMSASTGASAGTSSVSGAGLASVSGGATISRASTACYVDDAGVVQTAAINVLRYQGQQPLIETAATNLYSRSGDFNNATSWNKNLVTLAAASLAPDGTTSARGVIDNAGVIGYLTQVVPITAGTTYTVSVFVKAGGDTSVLLLAGAAHFIDAINRVATFTLTGNGSVSGVTSGATAAILAIPGGWYRISLTFTPTNTGSFAVQMLRGASNGDGTTVKFTGWGAQIEVGSRATSYIPTVATPATRADDLLVGTAAGVALAVADGMALAISQGLSAGVGTAAAQAQGQGVSAGVATVSGVGRSLAAGQGASAGVANVLGRPIVAGLAAGLGVASGAGIAGRVATGASAGAATAQAEGRALVQGQGRADGVGTATAIALLSSTGAAARMLFAS